MATSIFYTVYTAANHQNSVVHRDATVETREPIKDFYI